MAPRHKNELLTRLERVVEFGSCEIRHAELKLWYERDRLTKSVWADLSEKYLEICGDGARLLVRQGEGFYSFIANDGLSASKASSWKHLENWTG